MHEMRGDAPRSAFMEHDRLALNPRQAANPRTDRTTGAQPLFLGHVGQPGILQRLAGGVNAIDDEGIDLPLHLVIDAATGVKTIRVIGGFHLARDPACIVRRIKAGDNPGTRLRRQDVGPGSLDIRAQRRDKAQTGDDNTTHGAILLSSLPIPKRPPAPAMEPGTGSRSCFVEPNPVR